MDPEFQFLMNYRLLACENESLFWFIPIDYFEYEDLLAVVQSCPSHSLTIVTYYDSVEPLLELVRPHLKNLSWIKLGITHQEFRFKASLMTSTHFAASSFVQGIESLDEEAFEYLEWFEEQALSELTEIWNWSKAA
jgi:hypothetical protein